MSAQDKHIYTSEDISRYHSGAMSQAEMHAMEKAALEDPFLADALEGFVYSTNMNAELAELHGKLQEKTDSKVVAMPVRRRNYGWMRIAALFIVFAAAGWIIFRMNTKGENDLAIQTAPAEKTSDKHQTDVAAGTTSGADSTTETYVPVKEDETIAAATPRVNAPLHKSRNISLPPVLNDSKADVEEYQIDTGSIATNTPIISTETIANQKASDTYNYSAPRVNYQWAGNR
jgi:hypothetical protein